MRQQLSPGFIQAMIWLAAAVVVAFVAAALFTVQRPPAQPGETPSVAPTAAQPPAAEPLQPEPETAAEEGAEVRRPSPAVIEEPAEESEGSGPPERPPLVPESLRPDFDGPRRVERPPEPPQPEVPKRVPKPRGITEDQFVEASALMILARDSFTDTPEGRRSLEKACDGVLEERGIDKAAFEAYSEYLAGDAEARQRVRKRFLERADELRAPRVEVEVRPTPRRRSSPR